MTSHGLEVLSRAECIALLASHSVGRLGVKIGEQFSILPVLYGIDDDTIVIRTDPGMKLLAAVLQTRVVFEVDEIDRVHHTGWDVNVVGHAHEILDPDGIERARALGLRPWAGDRDRWIRIPFEHVTGRRITASG